MMAWLRLLRVLAVACAIAGVVRPAEAQQSAGPSGPGLLSRKTSAVTYEARRDTKVDLIGTPLMPRARGEAEIKTESSGPVAIKAKMRDLTAPTQFGPEYLTYVLWAIPPQGRAKNLGEVRLDDGKNEIEATVDVQTFSMIVTAEPYYAVTTPSEVVVMENAIRQETRVSGGHTLQTAAAEFERAARRPAGAERRRDCRDRGCGQICAHERRHCAPAPRGDGGPRRAQEVEARHHLARAGDGAGRRRSSAPVG
jgi:hypothetical protein